jgi:hypothetical protein
MCSHEVYIEIWPLLFMRRTKDGRFVEKRVRVESILLRKIIQDLKLDYTWQKLSEKLSVSTDTIRIGWLVKNQTIPFSLFEKLVDLHSNYTLDDIKENIQTIEPYWGQGLNRFQKKVSIPDIHSEQFAEFYGALIGDGCLYTEKTGFCISGHSTLDSDYIGSYMSTIIFELFCVKPRLYFSKEEKSLRCVLYSQKVLSFLESKGFPLGKKVESCLVIPEFFLKDKRLLISCLRGLFDTDGTIYHHEGAKVILEISITNRSLIDSCFLVFESLDIPMKRSKNRLYLIGKKKVKEFYFIIGSSNLKHIMKFDCLFEGKRVPLSEEIEKLLKEEEKYKINHEPVI